MAQTKDKSKNKGEPANRGVDVETPPTEGGPLRAATKRISRHVQPVGPRVLVRIVKSPDRSESGLFLPQGVKDASSEALLGEVLEVARTMPKTDPLTDVVEDDDDERGSLGHNVSGIPLGSNVLFEKDRGVSVPWDDSLRLLEVRHVLALVDIITEDELQ